MTLFSGGSNISSRLPELTGTIKLCEDLYSEDRVSEAYDLLISIEIAINSVEEALRLEMFNSLESLESVGKIRKAGGSILIYLEMYIK